MSATDPVDATIRLPQEIALLEEQRAWRQAVGIQTTRAWRAIRREQEESTRIRQWPLGSLVMQTHTPAQAIFAMEVVLAPIRLSRGIAILVEQSA
jgi:hypothetical protein